ncbi:pecanex-like protein 4 isoform X1 [Clarias gariepinus]|uniref:pecanex-like protein 4 isoform X1 n=2 Tax=Clarias gariepinus TaxID=13013 RepID=UPI00234C7B43|nr:pecanex-like protein 4 isoform X1 [Clarias gariepinus]
MLQQSEQHLVITVKEDAGGNLSTLAFIMGPDVPLLNDYKQEFFWKRVPQTVLGGLRLKLGYCAPPYVYIHQVALFFMPWLLGGVGTLLFQFRVMDDSSAGIVSGGLMLSFGAVLQTLSQWVARRTGAVQRLAVGHNVMADEEEVEFTRCAGPETVRFVAPGKRFMANVVLHTVLAGAMCGFGTWYLLPDRLTAIFGNVGAVVPVFTLSWVTLCIGEYALIVNTAAETATFQPQDTYEITALTRPLYIFSFVAVDLALRCVGGGVAELQVASQVMHVLFLVLPVLWALGMLPPLDALVLWIMEQSLIHIMGGSAMATNRRLVLMFLSSVCVSVSTFFIPSTLGVVLFTVPTGFILSQDLTQIAALLRCRRRDTHPNARSLSMGWWSVPLSALVLAAAMTEAALLNQLCPAGGLNVTEGAIQGSCDTVPDPQALIGWILVALCVITRVLREIQGACVLGGLVLNPLYPKRLSSVQAFMSSSRGLWVAALVRRALINLVCPLAMVGFLATDASLYKLHSVASAVGLTRAFRAAWQSSEEALLQMAVVVLVRLADGGGVAHQWHDLGIGVQLIVVSLVSDRLSQFLLKLKFALTVLITSWTETKQRRQSAGALLGLNVALCPLLVGVLVLSALLSAPLLPLFTLPVFLVGFPRPLRSWPGTPGTACPCPDSIYYQQLSARLASALTHAFASGALGAYSAGSHFLGRFQDRVVWISVLEKGYGYCTVNIKGLELQETSCHTVEARRVDEVFEAAFDRLERPGRLLRFLNPHWGNTLTPCALLPVTVYSDARNVLTGIIDSPDHLRQLRSDFLKTLVWILLHHTIQNRTYRVKSHSLPSSQHAVQPEPNSHDAKLGVVSQSHFDSSSSPQLRGRSSLSSLSDWSDEDDLFGPVPVRKPVRRMMMMRAEEEHASLPGSVEIHSLYENMALASLPTLRPLGLGVSLDKEKDDAVSVSPAPFPMPYDRSNPPNFSSPHSESLSLPTSWSSAPFTISKLRPLRPCFPDEWFRFCLSQLVMEGLWEGEDEQGVCRALQEDRVLMEMYSQVALSCALALGMDISVPSASLVFRVYCGDAAWHEGLDWLRENTELHQLTLRAFRYSVKLLIDQASLGPVESEEELHSTLHHYHHDWFVGMATERGWHDGVLQEKPFLFSLGHDLTMGSYTGRVLSLQECVFQVGALCEECVRGQWANLSWELLYATNDDEERYSIQAHTLLLRNLTVQAAEPPLGYPIYSCRPTHLTCF